MPKNKGFTLIEIVTVMVIVGLLIAFAVPNYMNFITAGAAKAAQSNLITIYNAQKNYFFSNTAWCTSSTSTPTGSPCLTCAGCDSYCATNLADINCNLGLNIVDNNYSYTCNNTSQFNCIASLPGNSFTLTLTNNPIVLVGASGCTDPSGGNCNPICSPSTSTFCPTP